MKWILASASPRRRELLGILGHPFEIMVSEQEEELSEKDPILLTERLSRQKAEAVFRELEEDHRVAFDEEFCIIGADTVVFSEEILGKPADRQDAKRMIKNLQGKSHTVCTGVTLLGKKGGEKFVRTFSEQTKVYVAEMSEQETEEYLDTDEPYDKAGAYGIQGLFSKFIEKIEGDYYNVVGLPVHRLYREMKSLGGGVG